MKSNQPISIAMFFLAAFSVVLMSAASAADPTGKSLLDFDDASIVGQWQSVNDGVMGGISEGNFRITDDDTLLFFGNLSLENNGGFASIRTRPANLNLDGYDTIAVRIKGDGRSYYLNLRTFVRRTAASYRAPVQTRRNTWQEVRVPLTYFVYTAYGRRVAAAPIRGRDIRSVGFTLADKQPGPFRLEISSIQAEKQGADLAGADESRAEAKDIVDTAVAAGNFNTLVAAVQAAGLVEALKAEGPLTVFAPSDDAFAKLPAGTVENLLRPENREELVAVLSYHVLPGKISLRSQSLDTLQGQALSVNASDSFQVNGAKVLASDIAASNGVIHVIDSVLIPPAAKLTPQGGSRELIELAIRRGVPLFNAGQASACAAIYEVAIESLLKSHTDALSDRDRSTLGNALRQIRREDGNPSQQAWTLRHALDAVYASLASS